LIDVIAAGHTHEAVAHVVEGIAIVQAYPRGQAFARADVVVDRSTRRVNRVTVFAPHPICVQGTADALRCGGSAEVPAAPVSYEGRLVAPDPAIVAAMAPALARVRDLQATPLPVVLDTPLVRDAGIESPLGNLFADALLENSTGADLAITNNRMGGLRADLPAGPMTFGRLYDVFPFDNRTVRLTMTAADLARVLADEVNRGRPGALAVSGLRIRATCAAGHVSVQLSRPSGHPVAGDETVVVATVDSMAAGVVFSSVRPPGPLVVDRDAPLLREVVEQWFRRRNGRLTSAQFVDSARPRWEYGDGLPTGCGPRL
jgi:5'-nucleotidase